MLQFLIKALLGLKHASEYFYTYRWIRPCIHARLAFFFPKNIKLPTHQFFISGEIKVC